MKILSFFSGPNLQYFYPTTKYPRIYNLSKLQYFVKYALLDDRPKKMVLDSPDLYIIAGA